MPRGPHKLRAVPDGHAPADEGWSVMARPRHRRSPRLHPATPPAPQAPSGSLADLRGLHARSAALYAASALRTELHRILCARLAPGSAVSPLRSAVLLALGSLSSSGVARGVAGGARADVGMLQLVVFEDIVAALRDTGHPLPNLVAQDPMFNHLDAEFLGERGFDVVPMPRADALGTREAFVFAPHAPREATKRVLSCAWPEVEQVETEQRGGESETLAEGTEKGEAGEDGEKREAREGMETENTGETGENECRAEAANGEPRQDSEAVADAAAQGPGLYIGNSVREQYDVEPESTATRTRPRKNRARTPSPSADGRWARAWLARRHEQTLDNGGRCGAFGDAEWAMYGLTVYVLNDLSQT